MRAYHVPPSSGMVKLDAMENPYRLPVSLRNEIGGLLSALEINRYPDPAAPALKTRLREVFAIADAYDILIGNGSDEIIQIVAQTLARPGAVMLAPEPSFVMYKIYATLARMNYVAVPLNRDFTIDVERFLAAIDQHNPALIFLAYPNNPTGNLFPEDAMARVIEAAPGLVVVDEAYHVFAGKTLMTRLAEFPNLMVMRTVSKLGLAGIRLGYAIARPEWIRELDKARPPYNVNVLTQSVAEHVLAHVDALQKQAEGIKQEREGLVRRLNQLAGVETFPSDANFVLVRVPDADKVHMGLKQRSVLVRNFNGSHPLLDNCLRLTVGTPDENRLLLSALVASL
jgi:histidinol-phosphate aminotransferase